MLTPPVTASGVAAGAAAATPAAMNPVCGVSGVSAVIAGGVAATRVVASGIGIALLG